MQLSQFENYIESRLNNNPKVLILDNQKVDSMSERSKNGALTANGN